MLGEDQPIRSRGPGLARSGWTACSGVAHVPEDRGLFFDLTTADNFRLGRPRGRGAPDPLPMEQILEWFPRCAT